MKQPTTVLQSLTFIAFAAGSLPLWADTPAPKPVEVKWETLCHYAKDYRLVVTTTQGDVVEGHCLAVQVNELVVTTKDYKTVRIARAALAKIHMQPSHGNHLQSLGKGMRQAFHEGFQQLLSPLAPVGLVVIPGTVAWGAIAAPFCAIGDLSEKLKREHEVVVR